MEVIAGFVIIFSFLTTLHPLNDIPEDQVDIHQQIAGIEQNLKFEVTPFEKFKNQNIVKQQFDYSCGSAALATLLNYYLGEKLSEQQVIQGLMEYGDSRLIQERRAFSLLDMKQFVTVLGYQGAGYTAELDDLKTIDKPCIVPIEFFGYKHFVVYKGMYNGHMFFADPYMGNISFTASEFQEMWHKNIVFMVTTGESTLSALRLKEEDLRLVSFTTSRDFQTDDMPWDYIQRQRELKESVGATGGDFIGRYQYYNTIRGQK